VDHEDTEPWYKQFWPWFIIALLASSVVAGLTTVWISLQTSDSLVIQSDDGTQAAAERRINAEKLAAELGLAALIEINLDTGAISAAMRAGALDSVPAALLLEFTHPAFADRDQVISLHRAQADESGNPVWVGHFVDIPEGRWYVTLKSGDDWRLASEWRGESNMTMRPVNVKDNDGG